MLKKFIASFLMFTVTMLTLPTTRTFAQAPLNSAGENYLRESPAIPKPNLKAVFASEMSSIKAGTSKSADFNKMASQNQQQQAKPGWTRKQKLFLALGIVLMAGLMAVAIKHGCKGENKCENLNDNIFLDY